MQLHWAIAIWANPSLKILFSLYGFLEGETQPPQLKSPHCIWIIRTMKTVFCLSFHSSVGNNFLKHSSPIRRMSVYKYQGSLQLVSAVEKGNLSYVTGKQALDGSLSYVFFFFLNITFLCIYFFNLNWNGNIFLSFQESGFIITHLVFTPLCHSLMSESCLSIASQVVRPWRKRLVTD